MKHETAELLKQIIKRQKELLLHHCCTCGECIKIEFELTALESQEILKDNEKRN